MECWITINHRSGDNNKATVNDGRQVRIKDPQKILRTVVAGITGTVRNDVKRIGV
ncbi:hypothetical protein TICEST70_03461 [Cutibacterium acnes PRP-38]|nr:hypothetical protein TICEST70_03461 [Cutibacterium acnes PRP-38]